MPRKYHVGQQLWYVRDGATSGRYVMIERIGRRWLYCSEGKEIDRKTLKEKSPRGFATLGQGWLTRDDHERYLRRHDAWRHFRRQVQDKWSAPENVTLEQIQAACDLLRLAAHV